MGGMGTSTGSGGHCPVFVGAFVGGAGSALECGGVAGTALGREIGVTVVKTAAGSGVGLIDVTRPQAARPNGSHQVHRERAIRTIGPRAIVVLLTGSLLNVNIKHPY